VRVRGFGETPGTLRDNQVDAPLEAGDASAKGSGGLHGRAFNDPDAGRDSHDEAAPPAIPPRNLNEIACVSPLVSLSSVVGRVVKNPEGVTLGTIQELMANAHSGAIAFAIISVVGGVLSSREAMTSLPWKALKIQDDGSIIYDSLGNHDA
jgi:sporulation protein YlmC with PRC-barrel domain